MTSRATVEAVSDRPATTFTRPSRADAVAVARAMFVRGDRVDMQPLAERLGIGRTTLYRWVGDREHLLGEVLAQLTDETFELIKPEATGDGVAWAIDVLRRFMLVTSTFPPLRSFAELEPQLALRVLLSSRGAVSAQLATAIGDVLADPRAGRTDGTPPELVDTLVQIGTALEWAPITIGQEPEVDRATRLMESLLRSA